MKHNQSFYNPKTNGIFQHLSLRSFNIFNQSHSLQTQKQKSGKSISQFSYLKNSQIKIQFQSQKAKINIPKKQKPSIENYIVKPRDINLQRQRKLQIFRAGLKKEIERSSKNQAKIYPKYRKTKFAKI